MKACLATVQVGFLELVANLGLGAEPVNAIPSMRTALAQPDLIGTLPDRFREVLSQSRSLYRSFGATRIVALPKEVLSQINGERQYPQDLRARSMPADQRPYPATLGRSDALFGGAERLKPRCGGGLAQAVVFAHFR